MSGVRRRTRADREELGRRLRNQSQNPPYRRALSETRHLLLEPHWDDAQQLEATEAVTAKQLAEFVPRLLSRVLPDGGVIERASPIHAATSTSPSRLRPVWKPARSRAYTRSSVATFPVAFGANGQPPMPPMLASTTPTPASMAAAVLATPVLRVSWK